MSVSWPLTPSTWWSFMSGAATTSGMVTYDSEDTWTESLFLFESYSLVVILELLTGKSKTMNNNEWIISCVSIYVYAYILIQWSIVPQENRLQVCNSVKRSCNTECLKHGRKEWWYIVMLCSWTYLKLNKGANKIECVPRVEKELLTGVHRDL